MPLTRKLLHVPLFSLLLGALLLSGCSRHDDLPGLLETRDIAAQGLVYGLPVVSNFVVTYGATNPKSATFRSPFNTLRHETKLLTWESRAIVTPNSDTLYSTAWLDLRAEPIIVSVPKIDEDRYYSAVLIDASTNNAAIFGTRTTGNAAGEFMIVGPDWQGTPPTGIKAVYRSGSQLAFLLFRTQLFRANDLPNVLAVQKGYQVRTLSAYLGTPTPPAAPAIDFPEISKELAKKNFFKYLDFSLAYIPTTTYDQALRAQLARIGVGPGRTIAFNELPWLHKMAALWGMKRGNDLIEETTKNMGKTVNGWYIGVAGGSAEDYQQDWLRRAVVARAGIYALDAAEAVYPIIRLSSDGQKLDTSKHRYQFTFPANSLPPAKAFWSVTIYDTESQFLVKNPINRYLINAPMLPDLKRNADGSITIYVQKDSPGAALESNWLPGPDQEFYMVMRLYWPKMEAPSIFPLGAGSWQPPAVERVD